ncbi:MAG: hypothetical protein EWV76_23775 [Microcystis novacekii Mn_MB_F_20050700_S1]|uniref:Uncharacterized protein n=1 Tax=Microcystis novacekii Mn_MB_F_20050700_S1D TaxID=2486266 RepID=A0A552IJZ1_9CHRO|nr:MAG: hypothetical protein EWV76_23775 [Microcystis novacekii Mn_MB_F_20050700_S1]TRU83786.1 MAG: hypothetical protein EWV54_19365 [Microcystis novacekii Mn_MB_F_20050700_S1D]
MNSLLQMIPPSLRTWAKRLGYFLGGTMLTVFYAGAVPAQSLPSPSLTQNPYSPTTIIAGVIAAIMTIFFLRGMYLVLTYASATYGLEDEEQEGNLEGSQENHALLSGAFGWIIGSALIITSYGFGGRFLYIGPLVCLLGPLVPIFAMNRDIQKYRQVLARRARYQSSRSLH